MKLAGVLFGGLVAFALAGHNVQQLRPFQLTNVAQGFDQGVDIVAVDRADVVEAEFFEQRAGDHHALHVFFGAPRQFPHRGHFLQDFLAAFAHGGVHTPGQDSRQVIRQAADVG